MNLECFTMAALVLFSASEQTHCTLVICDWRSDFSFTQSEPPLDQHMPFFTGKCFPCTGQNYSHWYQVPAETEHFVRLARDHTVYPGSWSKWKLLLNKITSDDVQQVQQWTRKLSLPLATKLNLIIVCKGWVVSTRQLFFPHQHWRTCTSLLGN